MIALVAAPRSGLAISLYDAHSIRADVGGDVKVFLLGVVPYKHALLPSDPSARALLDLRLKLNVTVGQWLLQGGGAPGLHRLGGAHHGVVGDERGGAAGRPLFQRRCPCPACLWTFRASTRVSEPTART